MNSQTDSEKNFTSLLIMTLALLDHTPTPEEVEEKAKELGRNLWI